MDPELVGRTSAIAAIRAAEGRGARIVCVRGAPGVGKSAVARALGADVFVPLEDARGDAAVLAKVAAALDVALAVAPADEDDHDARIVGALDALGARAPITLVLDGADRNLVALSERLARWRARTAPGVTFVVTAERALAVSDADVVLEPLSVPPEGASLAAARASDAFALFVAQAARRGFSLSAGDVEGVVAIVRALDGLPLALVLGAARIAYLGVDKMRALLTRRFALLAPPGGDDDARSRSLEAALASSWELCTPRERALLERASVFEGGFTLDAMHAVMGGAGEHEDELATLSVLEALVAASLVIMAEPAARGEGARFALLESVRAFAARAADASTRAEAISRHAAHYVALAEAAASRVKGPDGLTARRLLEREAANIAAASERDVGAIALRAALSLEAVMLARGPVDEHVARVSSALTRARGDAPANEAHHTANDASAQLDPALEARAVVSLGLADIYAGRREAGVARLKEALAQAERCSAASVAALAASKAALVLGLTGAGGESASLAARAEGFARAAADAHLAGVVAKDRGMVLAEAGDNRAAIAAFERALEGFRAAGDAREEAFTLAAIGARYLDDGALAEAKRHVARAAEMLEALGDKRTQAWSRLLLALAHLEETQLEAARKEASRALDLASVVGDRLTEGLAWAVLGHASLEGGDAAAACDEYAEGAKRLLAVRDRRNAAIALGAWASAAAACGERAHASRLLDEARGHTRERGRPGDDAALALFGAAVKARSAEHAAAAGDGERADAELAEASRVVAEILAPDRRLHRSDEVRLATRVAHRAIDEVAPRVRAMRGFTSAPAVGLDASRQAGPRAALVLDANGRWLRLPDGTMHKLRGKPVAARLLRVLVDRALGAPGEPVPSAALIDAGWPGEKILPKAAHNRLYVAMTRLRQMGLGALLENDGDGYFFSPNVAVRLAREVGDA